MSLSTVHAHHDRALCFECARIERERRRAPALLPAPAPAPSGARFPMKPALSERELTHRRAMLAHLQQARQGSA
jgi:hypothetical protein